MDVLLSRSLVEGWFAQVLEVLRLSKEFTVIASIQNKTGEVTPIGLRRLAHFIHG